MEILHSGFDAIYVAFQGAASRRTIQLLDRAKVMAEINDEPSPCDIGGVSGLVMKNGAQGGYAYLLDTGPAGEVWKFKRSDDLEQWNMFVEVRAATCATLGFDGVRSRISEQLDAFGARVMTHSINRLDFAVDVAAPVVLDPARFVCHSRATVSRHYELPEEVPAFSVIGNRRVTSITIGRNPSRVVQVYDKRHEQKCRGGGFWFEVWGVDKEDCPPVWRVELRAHSNYLKDWNIRTFDDAAAGMLDVFKAALTDVRYVRDAKISNISRAALDPLWIAVVERVCSDLFENEAGLVRGRIIEIKREDAERQYSAQVRGLIAGLCVVRGKPATLDKEMSVVAEDMVAAHIGSKEWCVTRRKAENRFHFIEGPEDGETQRRA